MAAEEGIAAAHDNGRAGKNLTLAVHCDKTGGAGQETDRRQQPQRARANKQERRAAPGSGRGGPDGGRHHERETMLSRHIAVLRGGEIPRGGPESASPDQQTQAIEHARSARQNGR